VLGWFVISLKSLSFNGFDEGLLFYLSVPVSKPCLIIRVEIGSANAVNLTITMGTEIQIESAKLESLGWQSDEQKPVRPAATKVVRILSPDDMAGKKWWLDEWYLEWKTLADIRNDTDFLIRFQKAGKLKSGFNPIK
jgi:hypothetical protein